MTIRNGRFYEVWHDTGRNRRIDVNITPLPGSGDLALVSPYSPEFVAAFKQTVPGNSRRWDNDNKRWLFSPPYAGAVIALVQQHYGVTLPPVQTSTATSVIRVHRLEYLGAAKPRDGWDELVAFGFADGDWRLAFPVSALLRWFDPSRERPGDAATLYSVLGCARTATADDVKRAYRRAARAWHPDVCHEPDAKQQFQAIGHAYSVLSDETARRKYDCGLALASSLGRGEALPFAADDRMWRPPLRCGYVMAEGVDQLGRFVVSKISGWEDVTDERGRTMVTSWRPGADTYTTQWV